MTEREVVRRVYRAWWEPTWAGEGAVHPQPGGRVYDLSRCSSIKAAGESLYHETQGRPAVGFQAAYVVTVSDGVHFEYQTAWFDVDRQGNAKAHGGTYYD